MADSAKDYVVIGKISSAYGIKGWVKVYSYTDPMDRILDYTKWSLRRNGVMQTVEVNRGRSHGKGMVAHLKGYDNRNAAEAILGSEIVIVRSELPPLADGEFYWFELQGLSVVNTDGVRLGKVTSMMSAGSANDVMIVKGDSTSVDQDERLIPYVMDVHVKKVDLVEQVILVDWEAEF